MEDGFQPKLRTFVEGQSFIPLADGNVGRDEIETTDAVIMIYRDLVDGLDFNFLELPNCQLLDTVKGPAVGELENAEPCLKGRFVHRVFTARRQQTSQRTRHGMWGTDGL